MAYANFKEPHCMQQEQHTQADEDGGRGGNLGGLDLVSGTERLRKSERIRSGLARLNRLGRANGIQNLVHPEEAEKDSNCRVSLPRKVVGETNDRQDKNTQVGKALCVLAAIDRT